MGLPGEGWRKDIFEHYLRGLKLDPRLAPDRLAADLERRAPNVTSALWRP
jgi:hypothetical protein